MAVKCILTGQTPSVLDGVTENVQTQLNDKVDKVTGKGLSTNDYTNAEKTKLSGIETGAQKNTITGVKGNAETTYRTGNVNITATNIGLGNVDNTSDVNKPISNATQEALNGKQVKITASGLLKGDGAGGVTTATKGTDYVASPEVFIATYGTTTSAEIEAAYQAGKTVVCVYKDSVYYLSRRMSETRHIFSTIFPMSISASMSSYLRKIACISDVWESSGNLGFTPQNHSSTHASGGSDPITPADVGAQPSISANGILKGDGSGGVSAAVKGTDYAGISETITATLLAASWTGTSAPYSYTLTVNGVTVNSNQELLPALNITEEQLTALQAANIQDGGQAANSITLTAFGDKPTIDLPIRVIVRGDS